MCNERDGQEDVIRDEVTLEQINITHLDHNVHFVLARHSDVIGFAEHKLKPG